MTGAEQFTVWLFGILCAAISVCSVARSLAEGRSEAARHMAAATVESNKVVAEVRGGVVYPPSTWHAGEAS